MAKVIYDAKKRFCLRGHDTHVLGRRPNYSCIQCDKERKARIRKGEPQPSRNTHYIYDAVTRFCNVGHDTHKTGRVGPHHNCVMCNREYDERRRRRDGVSPRERIFLPRLKSARENLGLSQRDLGSRIGVSCGHISNIENGGGVSRKYMAKILRAIAEEIAKIRLEDAA